MTTEEQNLELQLQSLVEKLYIELEQFGEAAEEPTTGGDFRNFPELIAKLRRMTKHTVELAEIVLQLEAQSKSGPHLEA